MPAGGSVQLGGEELLAASDRRLRQLRASRMAMIFQEPMTALNPVLTVGRQIQEVLEAHTDLDARRAAPAMLEMLAEVQLPDIERIFDSYPHQLSGGQRQRIMIAMALILEPKLLIADEPTTALDVTTQKQILRLIRELQERHGTSVLFVTHDMGVVADIADRVAVMHNGRIVETGATRRNPARGRSDGIHARPADGGAEPGPAFAARGKPSEPVVLETNELGKIYRDRSLFRRAREVAAAKDVSFTLARVARSASSAKAARASRRSPAA